MRLSQEKRNKIAEQVLLFLYNKFPNQLFTSEIAREVARDEEFIKKLLFGLKDKGLTTPIRKNSKGVLFNKRVKWLLSSKAYEAYKMRQ